MINIKRALIDRYTPFLEKKLTPNRLQHSLGVMQVMEGFAGVYALDPQKAITAGLLHDAGKELPPAKINQLLRASPFAEDIGDLDYNLYLHGPVGALLVEKELGITDPLILDAIYMHTFMGAGEHFDSPFVWCLRFSDILEPNRNWSDVRWFREGKSRLCQTVLEGRLAEGAFLHTGWLIKMFEEKGFPIHANIYQAHHELSSQLNLDDAFLEL